MAGIRRAALLAAAAVGPALVNSRRVVVVAAVICLAGYVWVYATGLAGAVIRSDGFSYYVYVPSWLLYRDTKLVEVAQDCCGGVYPDGSGLYRWPGTRRWVNVHPIGVAIMQAPAFPLAHALTRWSNLTPDGFSLYYHHAVGAATLTWAVAGLAVLRRLLLMFFRDAVVALSLIVTLLGTNLFHYATFDASHSHVYSFFLFSALLYLTALWHRTPSTRFSVLIGLVAGMIVLTRHTNALFLSSFVLYAVTSGPRGLITRMASNRWQLGIIASVAALVLTPQIAIYYQATGHFLISSYGDLGFNWTTPRLFAVLFGVTKGLFFWSPLLLLSIIGFAWLWRQGHPARAFMLPAVAILPIHTYFIAAWWDWQLGGSYGSRGYVDTLPLFAVGLAGFFQRMPATRGVRAAVGLLVGAGCALSVFQMFQYWYGIIPISDTTWDLYRSVFLRWR